MTVLVLLDHEGSTIKQPSRSAIAAAQKLGEVHALVAGTNPATMRKVVVLPQPEGPSSTTISPGAMSRLTASTANAVP